MMVYFAILIPADMSNVTCDYVICDSTSMTNCQQAPIVLRNIISVSFHDTL